MGRTTIKMLKSAKLIALTCGISLLTLLTACGKSQIAISDSGEDITEAAKNYTTVAASRNKKFSYDDLTFNGTAYLTDMNSFITQYPNPTNIINASDGSGDIIYQYSDRSFTFSSINGEMRLSSVMSENSSDTFARGIKVGMSYDGILSVFYRDSNYMNNSYKLDGVIVGKMLYGDVTIDDLEKYEIKSELAYGVINYSGYDSLENADEFSVTFTYMDGKFAGSKASISDDFAEITFICDKDKKIKNIRWTYYPQENI